MYDGTDLRGVVMQDANYNVVAISVPGYSVGIEYTYDPYGEWSAVTYPDLGGENHYEVDWINPDYELFNIHGFQGRPLRREVGLHDFRNRRYEAPMGRFTSQDPNGTGLVLVPSLSYNGQNTLVNSSLSLHSQYTDGLGLYTPFGNNPLTNRDPSGLAYFQEVDSRDDLLVSRDWDSIYDSIVGDQYAFLGVQGAGTLGGFWGENVAVLSAGAHRAAQLSEGFSQFADYYAEELVYLPVDSAFAGIGVRGVGRYIAAGETISGVTRTGTSAFRTGTNLGFASSALVGGTRFARTSAKVAVKYTDAVSQLDLRGKSYAAGARKLEKLGLKMRITPRKRREFVDPKTNKVRAAWDPKNNRRDSSNHWHKFAPDGERALNNAGRVVAPDSTAAHIRSR